MSYYKSAISWLKRLVYRDMVSYSNKYSLEYLRDKIFLVVTSVLTLCIAPIMFYGAYLFYRQSDVGLALLEAFLCIAVLFALNTKRLAIRIKKRLIILILYIVGVFLTVFTGPSGAGLFSIVFSFMLSVSLISKRSNVRFFIMNLIVMAVLTGALYSGLLDELPIFAYKQTWIINLICLQMGVIMLFFLWDIIYSGLDGQVERFELAICGSSDGIWDWDLITGDIYYSARWKEQLGYCEDELSNGYKTFYELIHPDDKEKAEEEFKKFIKGEQNILDCEIRMRHKSGDYRWIRTRGAAYRDEKGKAYRMAGSHTDITERREAERALEQSEEMYRMIAENTADVIWVMNASTMKFTYMSPSVERIRGLTVEEAMMETAYESMPPEYGEKIRVQMEEYMALFAENPKTNAVAYNQVQQYSKNRELRWLELSAKCRLNGDDEIEVIGVSRDITDRIQREERLKYVSSHDQLTNLLNQYALRLVLLEAEKEYGEVCTQSVISLDIDNFRVVNDSLGHDAGDSMLVKLAQRIKNTVGERATVYRNEGDEFVVIVPSSDSELVRRMAKEIQRAVTNQIKINDRLFFLTTSVGICLGEQDKNLGKILKNADTALYLAKKKKNSIVEYDASMDKMRTWETLLEEDLNRALEKEEFVLHYQPIIDIQKEKFDHVEALIRWNHPEFGMVSPSEFIPIAEKTKLIIPITRWVVRECCKRLKAWEVSGITDMNISINLSLMWFENQGQDITDFIISAVEEMGIRPDRITLEITETSLMSNPDEIIEKFNQMKQHGLCLALDDFGTGYSSFGYLKDLPLDVIKLDRSLMEMVAYDKREQMIVQTMITIAHELDLQVVAEGVEAVDQYEFLKQCSCDHIQGYLFSRPLKNEELIKYYFSMNEPGKLMESIYTENPVRT